MEKTASRMSTYSGKVIDFDGGTNVYDIEDIAHSLARQCRFNGHTPQHYSIAEHCVHMARQLIRLDKNLAYEALLHDAHEAYTGDVISPIKHKIPDFVLLEHRIACEIMESHGVGVEVQETEEGIKLYVPSLPVSTLDKEIAQHEAGTMMLGWGNINPDFPALQFWSPDKAKKEYLRLYERLSTVMP